MSTDPAGAAPETPASARPQLEVLLACFAGHKRAAKGSACPVDPDSDELRELHHGLEHASGLR
jgi:hypothetical protein